jgi:hypothetical protein
MEYAMIILYTIFKQRIWIVVLWVLLKYMLMCMRSARTHPLDLTMLQTRPAAGKRDY